MKWHRIDDNFTEVPLNKEIYVSDGVGLVYGFYRKEDSRTLSHEFVPLLVFNGNAKPVIYWMSDSSIPPLPPRVIDFSPVANIREYRTDMQFGYMDNLIALELTRPCRESAAYSGHHYAIKYEEAVRLRDFLNQSIAKMDEIG